MIPTQRLVVVPPFAHCRNPMILGTVVGYLGFGVWLGSPSAADQWATTDVGAPEF